MSLTVPAHVDPAVASASVPDGGALTLRAVAAADWDRAVAGFDGLCQEQSYAFAAARWPALDCVPILFSSGDDVIGGALVMIQELPLGLARVAITKWGPMLADETRADAPALYTAMVAALVARFSRSERMMLSIVPRPQPDGAEYAALRTLGFRDGSSVNFPDRYVVSLCHDADERMAGFAQKWRYHLRKSFKAELVFSRGTPDDLPDFMALYDAMSERKQFPDHSAIGTLPALLAMADGTARPEMFFVRKQGRVVAGAVIFCAGRMATYLYGATADDALSLRAGYFLHWHVMRWLAENTRCTHYDLGGTDGFQGLHQFKSGMVGTLGYIAPIPPIMHIAHALRPRILGHAAFAARDGFLNAREGLRRWRDGRGNTGRKAGGERA